VSAAPATDLAPPRTRTRAERLVLPLLFLALAVNAVDWALTKRHPGIDFAIFHRSALRLLRGEDLYPASDGFSPYHYAPGFAAIFVPFAAMPLRVAWGVFNLASAACLAAVMRHAARQVGRPVGLLGHALVLVAVYPLAVQLFRLGQVDGALLALTVASEALSDARPGASGLLWASQSRHGWASPRSR
jgi:hypothetical protein